MKIKSILIYSILFGIVSLGNTSEKISKKELHDAIQDLKQSNNEEYILNIINIGEPIVPLLLTELDDNKSTLKKVIFNILRQMGPKAKTAIPFLRENYTNEDERFYDREDAYFTLSKIDPKYDDFIREAIKDLEQMEDPDDMFRVVHMGEPAIPFLLNELRNKKSSIRHIVFQILERMGPKAKIAFPDLEKLFNNNDANYIERIDAYNALSSIDPNYPDKGKHILSN
ncbi:hypothetical protein BVX98_01750, partial [bacterium F11]